MKFSAFPRVFTVEEVADKLRTTPADVVSELESGKLSGFQVGGQWRVTGWALLAFMGAFGRHRRSHHRADRHAARAERAAGCAAKERPMPAFSWQTTAPFEFQWPRRPDGPETMEFYSEAFESPLESPARFGQAKLVVGFTTRDSAGMENRRRAVVFLVKESRRRSRAQWYPLVEFAGANDYEVSRRMASVIKLPNRTHLKPGDPIPQAYEGAETAPYSEIVSGPYASGGMAVVVKDNDLDSMARHALIRLRWSFGRRHHRPFRDNSTLV